MSVLNESSVEGGRLQLLELQNKWLNLTPEQREAMVLMVRDIHVLGPRACRILTMQAQRLAAGASYGDFEKGRKWGKEALEETIDQLHYMSAALLELKDTSE